MRTRTAKLLAGCVLCLIGTAANASAQAPAPGGATAPGSTGGSAAPGPTGGTTAGEPTSGGLYGPAGVYVGQSARFGGSFDGGSGATVSVEASGPGLTGWSAIATASADDHGAFSIRWRAPRIGHYLLRAQASSGGPALTGATVAYQPSLATWFGPRFSGEKTACGQAFTPALMGVAHRTLPCGTRVEIYYRGRAVTVPVVDRGPYTSASWDLTQAAAQALGFDGRDWIGALSPLPTTVRARVARHSRRHHHRHR